MQRIPAAGPVVQPRLDVRDLQVVLALASAGSTSRAAAVLHITQPAVSRALLLAEDKLGAKLFDRTARGLAPTPAGRRLIEGARPLLMELADLELRVGAISPEPLRVRIVCECYTAYRWLPSALASMRRGLPGLEVELSVDHTSDPVAALLAGSVDVALLTTAAVPRTLRERPLFSDEVVFLVAASHPLARRKALTVDDLRRQPLLSHESPPAEARWFVKRVFGRSKPGVRFERFPLTEPVIDATRAGMGMAVLSEWIASSYLDHGDLVVKRLARGPLRRPWRLAFRPDIAEAAERLHRALVGAAPSLK